MVKHLHRVVTHLLSLCLLPAALTAQPMPISGEQSGTFERGDYIIDEDIIVAAEKKLILAPGTKLLFNPHTKLTVAGELRCEGTEDDPIVFKTINTTTSSQTNDFIQWAGIMVSGTGRISLKHCEISHSLYGVQVPDTYALLAFENVSFYQNDNQLIIGEKPVLSIDTVNFSFQFPEKIQLSETIAKKRERRNPFPYILQYTFLCGAVGGLAGTIYAKTRADHYQKEYRKQTSEPAMEHYKGWRDKFDRYSDIGLAGTIASASLCAITVTVNISVKRKNK